MLKIKLLLCSILLFSNLMACAADKDKTDNKKIKEKIVLISKITTFAVAALTVIKIIFKISSLNQRLSTIESQVKTLEHDLFL